MRRKSKHKDSVCKVIEVFERNGHRVARVFAPGLVEIDADDMPDLHLGDLVRVSYESKLKMATPVFENGLAKSRRRKGS